MLRLQRGERTINTAHIEYVVVTRKDVTIAMASEIGITVDLKTEGDAICFAAYVELLVDISNTGQTDFQNEAVRDFEIYFEDYLRPSTLCQAVDRIRKHLNEQRRKS